jgi:hypothetical protein
MNSAFRFSSLAPLAGAPPVSPRATPAHDAASAATTSPAARQRSHAPRRALPASYLIDLVTVPIAIPALLSSQRLVMP